MSGSSSRKFLRCSPVGVFKLRRKAVRRATAPYGPVVVLGTEPEAALNPEPSAPRRYKGPGVAITILRK